MTSHDANIHNTLGRRVAIVTDYDFATGGIEQFVLQLSDRLSKRYPCCIVSWSEAVLAPSRVNARVIRHGDVRALWAELDAADIILVVTSFNVRLLARAVLDHARYRKSRVITIVQTSSHSDPSAITAEAQLGWLQDLLKLSDFIVAVSEDVRRAIIELCGASAELPETVVIENAARLRSTRPTRRSRDVVGFIGRPVTQKGFHLYERLARESSHLSVKFIANTVSMPPAQPVPEISHTYDCSDEELLDFFASLDLLVAPYLHSDGLPLALQEALNCGVPIMGFDTPGVGALLRRHSQIVIEPAYAALRSALADWKEGRLVVRQPASGTVASWDDVALEYARLIDCVTNPVS